MGRLCMELVTLGTLVGCGAAPTAPTTCEDLGDSYARVDQKARACLAPGDARGQTFDPGLCERNVGRCSEPEKKALGALADCFRAAPTCTPDTEKSFNSALFVCAVNAANTVGSDCLTILPETPEQSTPRSEEERILGVR